MYYMYYTVVGDYIINRLFQTICTLFKQFVHFGRGSTSEKAENTRLAARVFLCFSEVSQHPACLGRNIQNRESIWRFLIDSEKRS